MEDVAHPVSHPQRQQKRVSEPGTWPWGTVMKSCLRRCVDPKKLWCWCWQLGTQQLHAATIQSWCLFSLDLQRNRKWSGNNGLPLITVWLCVYTWTEYIIQIMCSKQTCLKLQLWGFIFCFQASLAQGSKPGGTQHKSWTSRKVLLSCIGQIMKLMGQRKWT